MERFRPSFVLDGLPAFGEDELVDLWVGDDVHLRVVKPCTRCVVTTTNQQTGEVEGDAPVWAAIDSPFAPSAFQN